MKFYDDQYKLQDVLSYSIVCLQQTLLNDQLLQQ